jgi:hypothetical protein
MNFKAICLGLITLLSAIDVFSQSDCKSEWRRLVLEKKYQRRPELGSCVDTVEAIRSLLKFENDSNVNSAFLGYTDYLPMYKSDEEIFEMEKEHDRIHNKQMAVSNQLAALYIISALYYGNYRFCSRIALYDPKKNKVITNLEYVYKGESSEHYKIVDDKVIRNIYKKTNKWLKLLDTQSLKDLREKNIPPPLNGLKWN